MRTRRAGRIVMLAALAVAAVGPVLAGGPVYMFDEANHIPLRWNLALWPNGQVPIYTDVGPLGPLANAQANGLVAQAAYQWSSVPTSSFRATIVGDVTDLGLDDVNSANFASISGAFNGGGIQVIYDNDGTILSDHFGVPPTSVLGIAEIELVTEGTPNVREAWLVLSGPGIRANDPNGLGFSGVVTHELGHTLNLAHTQMNGAVMTANISDPAQPAGCGAPWSGGPEGSLIETMYPFISPEPGDTGESMGTVDRLDDRAALSDLYPAAGWPAGKGTIKGQILDSSGNPVMGVNVIARNVADPFNDCNSYISGQLTKGVIGPDGSFVINGLTPGANYLLYTDQLLNGAFSVPRPFVLPGLEEYFNGALESGDGSTDDRCAWTPIVATAGSPVTADVAFNHFPGAPTFLLPPDLTVPSVPMDITADGRFVVGGIDLHGPVFRWDVDENTFDVIGGNVASQCAISDDGLKIAANVVDTDGINKAAIFANDAWTALPPVPGAVACDSSGVGLAYTHTYDMSGDGSTVVGLSYGTQGCGTGTIRAFKWTTAGGTVALPKGDAPTRASRANAVNYDGSVIVGWDDANSGQRRGAQWRNGVESLIRVGILSVGEALDVSSDGQYIVGHSNSTATNREPWLWSQALGVQPKGALAGQDSALFAALSDDASVMTGQSLDFDAATITPTIWTSGLGLMNFNQFLAAQGVVTTGLGMRLGMSMSANGHTIAGYANGPYGYVGWVLKTPTALVCHSSGTLAVAFPQGLDEHLDHGDTLGPCPCVDADGDGYSTCGGDCNDASPLIHFGAPDANCNGVDEDCDGVADDDAVPSQRPSVSVAKAAGDTLVSWGAVSATGYDIFAGDLQELRAGAGDYASLQTAACLGNDLATTSVSAGSELPAPGGGEFFLARAVGCAGAGTYDDDASQSGSRDAGIQALPEACP